MGAKLLITGCDREVNVSKDTPLIISREWIEALLSRKVSVADLQATISYREEDGKFYLEHHRGTTIYNNESLESGIMIPLEDQSAIAMGSGKTGVFILFYDDELRQKKIDSDFIKSITLDYEKIKSASERLARELYCDAPRKLNPFITFTLEYIMRKFKCHRGVFYKVDGTNLQPVIAKAPKRFNPPRKILDAVWESKIPQMFNITDVVDSAAEVSNSIANDNVCSAVGLPLMLGEKMVGLLYLDILQNSARLGDRELSVLCSLLPSITVLYVTMAEAERERVKAYDLFSAFCESNASDYFKVVSVPSRGYGFLRACLDGEIGVFVHLKFRSGATEDYTLLVAAYALILGVLDHATRGISIKNSRKIFEALSSVAHRFQNLNISIGTIVVDSDSLLTFTGYGDICLVAKPDKRIAFDTKTTSDYFEIDGRRVSEDHSFEVLPGTRLFLTVNEPNAVGSRMEKSVSFVGTRDALRKGRMGGLLVEYSKGDTSVDDGYKEIKLD